MPDNIKRIGKNSFYFPLVIGRIPGVDKIGEYPIIRMMITKLLGGVDLMFQTIDSYYPNLYCKKAAHWVNTVQILTIFMYIFILISFI